MIITCPDCATRYNIDNALIPVDGREVRCSACTALWHVDGSSSGRHAQETIIDITAASPERAAGRDYGRNTGAYFSRPTPRAAFGPMAQQHAAQQQNISMRAYAQTSLAEDDFFDEDILDNIAVDTTNDALFDELLNNNFYTDDNKKQTQNWGKVSDALNGLQLKNQNLQSKITSKKNAALKAQSISRHDLENTEFEEAEFTDIDSPETIEVAASQSLSPFHAELSGLEQALQKAGLTIKPIDDDATNASTGTDLATFEAGGAIQTIEGDVTKEQITRQYTETKKAASLFARSSTHLAKLFLKYVPPAFRKKHQVSAETIAVATSGNTASLEFIKSDNVSHKAVEGYRRRVRLKARNRLTPLRCLGWALWAGVATAGVYGIVAYRQDIINFWPKTATLYAAIGVKPAPPELLLSNVSHRYALSASGPVVEIRGFVQNVSDRAILTPQIEARSFDDAGHLLGTWMIDVPVTQVSPSMETNFASRTGVPKEISEIRLSVITPETGGSVSRVTIPGQKDDFFMQNTHGGWGAANTLIPEAVPGPQDPPPNEQTESGGSTQESPKNNS